MNRLKYIPKGALAAILLWAIPFLSHASCPADSINWLFLHPFFENKPWAYSADTMDFELPDTLCNMEIASVSMAGDSETAIAILGDNTGTLSAVRLDILPPVCLCCRTTITAGTPLLLDVSVLPGRPFRLIRAPNYPDTLELAAASDSALVFVYYMETAGFTAARVETLSLGNVPGGVSATGLWPDSGLIFDNGLWVTGDSGVIRYFARNDTAWDAMQIWDIAPEKQATAMGDPFAGTASGEIYLRQENGSFLLSATLDHDIPIRAISSSAAAGDNGLIAVRNGPAWNTVAVTGPDYRYFNLTQGPDGSIIEVLDAGWTYDSRFAGNTATTLGAILPSAVSAALNATPFICTEPMTVTMSLEDPDLDYRVPYIALRRGNETILLTTDNGDTLGGRAPSSPCEPGMLLLDSKEITLSAGSDMITLETGALRGVFSPTCFDCRWVPVTFTSSHRWDINDAVVIALGFDTLSLAYGFEATGTAADRAVSAGAAVPRIAIHGETVVITISREAAETLSEIRLFDALGRHAARYINFPGTGAIVLPRPLSAGMYYARYRFNDGNIITQALPALR